MTVWIVFLCGGDRNDGTFLLFRVRNCDIFSFCLGRRRLRRWLKWASFFFQSVDKRNIFHPSWHLDNMEEDCYYYFVEPAVLAAVQMWAPPVAGGLLELLCDQLYSFNFGGAIPNLPTIIIMNYLCWNKGNSIRKWISLSRVRCWLMRAQECWIGHTRMP